MIVFQFIHRVNRSPRPRDVHSVPLPLIGKRLTARGCHHDRRQSIGELGHIDRLHRDVWRHRSAHHRVAARHASHCIGYDNRIRARLVDTQSRTRSATDHSSVFKPLVAEVISDAVGRWSCVRVAVSCHDPQGSRAGRSQGRVLRVLGNPNRVVQQQDVVGKPRRLPLRRRPRDKVVGSPFHRRSQPRVAWTAVGHEPRLPHALVAVGQQLRYGNQQLSRITPGLHQQEPVGGRLPLHVVGRIPDASAVGKLSGVCSRAEVVKNVRVRTSDCDRDAVDRGVGPGQRQRSRLKPAATGTPTTAKRCPSSTTASGRLQEFRQLVLRVQSGPGTDLNVGRFAEIGPAAHPRGHPIYSRVGRSHILQYQPVPRGSINHFTVLVPLKGRCASRNDLGHEGNPGARSNRPSCRVRRKPRHIIRRRHQAPAQDDVSGKTAQAIHGNPVLLTLAHPEDQLTGVEAATVIVGHHLGQILDVRPTVIHRQHSVEAAAPRAKAHDAIGGRPPLQPD